MVDSAHVDAIRLLLGFIVLLCLTYFVLPDGVARDRSGRDLEYEHNLGGHARAKELGCPLCKG